LLRGAGRVAGPLFHLCPQQRSSPAGSAPAASPGPCRCFKTQDLGGSLAAESASDLAGLDAEPSEELFDFCRDIGSLFRHGHEPRRKTGILRTPAF
jgi:hypothetical protein